MRTRKISVTAALGAALFAAIGASHGCTPAAGCTAGDDGQCVPPSPCTGLSFACGDRSLEIRRIASAAERNGGLDALAARGDVLLGNSRFAVVLDDIDAPHYLAPSGGAVLDMYPRPAGIGTDDDLNAAMQAVGILPGDAVRYRTMELVDQSPDFVAVILRGVLDGRIRSTVVTRYEVRPCDPGVRVRTDLFHGERQPETFFLADAFYWGGREQIPFVPTTGRGFLHPSLELAKLSEGFVEHPFLASRGQHAGAASYAVVRCDGPSVEGFHADEISAVGNARTIVLPGDGLSYERFFAVAPGPGASRAIDVALEAREKLFGERSFVMRGRVVPSQTATLLVYDTSRGARVPVTEIAPDADGSFAARVPAGASLALEPHVLGRALPDVTAVPPLGADTTIADVVVAPTGRVDVKVTTPDGRPVMGEIVLTPTGPTTRAEVSGSLYGRQGEERCTPYLGPSHGGSPGCNRVLLEPDGTASFAAPRGTYWVYATAGPFSTIARARVDVASGQRADVALTVAPIAGLVPEGALSADFHVHGGKSFDSSFPDRDRVRSFVASAVDVIAATEHDVIGTYSKAIDELGLGGRFIVMSGVETTGDILFWRPRGADVPMVIGHFIFWPLKLDLDAPRNGMPWDELVMPGALFDRMQTAFDGTGVIQLNHPYATTTFGRDQGFFSAAKYDPRKNVGPPLTDHDPGAHAALDYDVEEVMNGTSTLSFLQYRTVWFSLLSQGFLRGGTANSDSHTLATGILGYPRNLVLGGHSVAAFDRERFDADVRAGHVVGTNGPVITASIGGRGPGRETIHPAQGATLDVEVRAAPWIPVDEVRFIVNGRLAKVVNGAAVAHPSDPFGATGLVRWKGAVAVADLLQAAGVPGGKDAWIVVEAGAPLIAAADLDDDGVPETSDNDGNGVIDERDHGGRDDKDTWYVEPPHPPESDARYHADVIAPGLWPTAFTNPFVIDVGGDGWSAPGL